MGLGLEDYATGIIAAGAVMQYIYETQKSTLEHITTITPYSTGQYMVIDTSTRRNLELVETMREKQKRGTLLWVLDKDSHGSQAASRLHRTAADSQRRNHQAPERGGRAEHELYLPGRDMRVLKSHL